MNETHQLIFACADKLGAMYDAAVYEHNLPTNFEGNLESKLESNSYFRRKRGIPILGEIISEITSIPGPQDWNAEISLRKQLSKAVQGNIEGMNHIRHDIITEHGVLEQIIPIINDIQSSTYINWICMQGTAYANRLP